MKNKFLIILPVFLVILATGCTDKKESGKKMSCTLNVENSYEDYTIELSRNIYYDSNKKVTKTTAHDIISSSNNATLNKYEESFNRVKNMYKNVKYYDVSVSKNGNTVTAVTNVDYTKVDTKKLAEITKNDTFFEKDGTLKLSTIKKAYEDSGLTCK